MLFRSSLEEARALYAVSDWHGTVADMVVREYALHGPSKRATSRDQINETLYTLFQRLNKAFAGAGLDR